MPPNKRHLSKRDRHLLSVKVGDSFPPLQATLRDSSGEPIDLSDPDISAIEIHADHKESGTATINSTPTIVDGPAGTVEYTLNQTETVLEGRHLIEFVIKYVDGRQRTVPQSGYYHLDVDEPVSRGVV